MTAQRFAATFGHPVRLADNNSRIAQQDNIALTDGYRQVCRMKKRQPFGIVVGADATIGPMTRDSPRHDCGFHPARIGPAPAVEVYF